MEEPNLNNGKPWSEMDVADLTNCIRRNEPIGRVAAFLCRTKGEVREKAAELNLTLR